MVKWEDYFDLPIVEVREALGITEAPPDGHWEWTYEAATG
jgi:hypothetical protein